MMTEEFKMFKKEYLNSLKEMNKLESNIFEAKQTLDEVEEFLKDTENHYVQCLCIWGEKSVDEMVEHYLKDR